MEPADDRCMAVKVVCEASSEDNTWQVSGEMFAIEAHC